MIGGSLALVGHALCANSDRSSKNCTWGTIKVGGLGLVTGAISGALIRGMFPKQHPPPASPGP